MKTWGAYCVLALAAVPSCSGTGAAGAAASAGGVLTGGRVATGGNVASGGVSAGGGVAGGGGALTGGVTSAGGVVSGGALSAGGSSQVQSGGAPGAGGVTTGLTGGASGSSGGGIATGGTRAVGGASSTSGGSTSQLAACNTQPLQKSAQWVKTGWTGENIYFDLYSNQDLVLARVWDGLNGGRVFLTTDNGGNWSPSSAAETDIDILSISATSPSALLAATWNGIYRSTSGGKSWDAATVTGMPADTAVRTLAAIGTSVYAGGVGAVYTSSDGGSTWV